MYQDNPIIPLQGPTGVRPKAPAVGAWQSPSYKGVELPKFENYKGVELPKFENGNWYGLRCDGLVVIDCDNDEAAKWWLTRAEPTWTRKTPRGWHFIYSQTPGSPDAPAAGVWDHIDIRAGLTSQIVFSAPGYSTVNAAALIRPFDPSWLPENFGVQQDRSNDESWDEIPDGRGNNTMAAFAGAFRKQGMSPQTMARCLGAINRITMTSDPMSNAEVAQIVMSVARYTAKPDIDIEVEE